MLNYYKVAHNGQVYYGNILLKECHLFHYNNDSYLVNVEDMNVHSISTQLSKIITTIFVRSDHLISEFDFLIIKKLKLIKENTDLKKSDITQKIVKKMDYPITSISLFVSQKCNMSCVYCYGGNGEYTQIGTMEKKVAFGAVDWLIEKSKNVRKINISFFGGEPLLNFSLIKETVYYSKKQVAKNKKNITFGITTNGSLLTDEIILFLEKENINTLISFDGPPVYQNNQRPLRNGTGSYDLVYNNIKKIRTVFTNLRARATILPNNDPFQIQKHLEYVGFSSFQLSKASPVLIGQSNNKGNSSEKILSEKMISYTRSELRELLLNIKERRLKRDGIHIMLIAIKDKHRLYYGCGVGKGNAAISTEGDIYPCHRFVGTQDMKVGSIFNYDEVIEVNEYYRAVVDNLPKCNSCWVRYYCGGGCFYNNKAHTGNIYTPYKFDCNETKILFEGLIAVYCQLTKEDKEYLELHTKGAFVEPHKDTKKIKFYEH